MKIAIIGQNYEAKKKVLVKFIELSSNYGSPIESIYDEEITVSDGVKCNEEWNEVECELYKRLSFVTTQMDKYNDKEYIIYVGHSLDVLVESMMYNFFGDVSDDFVEKIIYWNQKLMKKLDLIYWLPDAEKVLSEEQMKMFENKEELSDEEIEKLESHYTEIIYNNIWNEYINDFDNSSILPRECPGMGVFETNAPAAELAEIVQDLDDTKGKDTRLDDMEKLNRIIKDKKLLDGMKKVLMENTIPLPSGERITSAGCISLDNPV